MDTIRVFVEPTGRRIAPFDDPIGETPVLNRPLRAWQAEAFADGGFVVSPTLEPPCLVVPDTLFASGSALRAFVDAAGGDDAVLVLKHSEFAKMTTPVQPRVSEVDEGYLFEAVRYVSGRDGIPQRVVVDPLERVINFRLPGQYTGVQDVRIGLPRRPVMTLHHWVHILWVNQMAAGYEAMASPMRGTVLRVLWAVLRARSVNRWKVLRRLSTRGKRCDIHPTALIEGSTLGDGVTVGPNARVLFSRVGDGATIMAGAQVEYSVLGERSWVSQDTVLRFSVLYPDALAGYFLQLSVMGRHSMTVGVAVLDLNVERATRVELDGALHSSGQQFLGSAFGHRSRVGAGIFLSTGRMIPNDYLLLGDTRQVLANIPPGLADAGPLVVADGVVRPLRETESAAIE
ncbi:MAG: hypothetical protein AB7L91_04215 [Dehalococcoidia bacterium]